MKNVLIGLGAFFGLVVVGYMIACAMGPQDLNISREIDINAPKSVVYEQISELRNWENWSPWAENDPTLEVTYGEMTTGVGAWYSWTGESQQSGAGKLTIVDFVENESMTSSVEFEGQDPGTGSWTLTENEDGSTHVVWGMSDNELAFFDRGFVLFLGMEEMIKNTFDQGLGNIKTIAEENAANMPATPSFDILEATFPATIYVGIREEIGMADLGAFFGEKYGTIMSTGVEMVGGMPSAIYYEWNEETMIADVAAVIPVAAAPATLAEGMEVIEVAEGKALQINYYGSYDESASAHYAMGDYLALNDLESKMVIEEYVSDPMEVEDPSELLTVITYILQ